MVDLDTSRQAEGPSDSSLHSSENFGEEGTVSLNEFRDPPNKLLVHDRELMTVEQWDPTLASVWDHGPTNDLDTVTAVTTQALSDALQSIDSQQGDTEDSHLTQVDKDQQEYLQLIDQVREYGMPN